MKTKTLITFFLISFGLTWGIAAVLIFCYDQITAIFGEVSMTNPLFILAVYSPRFCRYIFSLASVWTQRPGQFLSTVNVMACSRCLVALPARWHSGAYVCRCSS